jgi:3-hydroxyisobutyrate dehydrogenase-like beta-hydroxyacid dehydrogenase
MRKKLISNLLVAVHNVAAAEALAFGTRLGTDPATAVKVLADGASSSVMLQVRGPVMCDRSWGNPGMKLHVWQKDISLTAAALPTA